MTVTAFIRNPSGICLWSFAFTTPAFGSLIPFSKGDAMILLFVKCTIYRNIKDKLEEAFADKEEWLAILGEAIYQYQKKTVRKMILKDHKRPDGRQLNQIRPLAAEVDIIPRVHGSAMFTRGQTQICNVTTLAPLSEAQKVDGLDENITTKRYLHHYNFPAYSVGETKVSRGPGRREIGHGALAERALFYPVKKSSLMQSVLYLKHSNQTVPHPWHLLVHPVCL